MSYTVLYSLLKYPAGVVPVTKVSRKDQEGLRNYIGHYNDEWDANIKMVICCDGNFVFANNMVVAFNCVDPASLGNFFQFSFYLCVG